MVVYFEGGGLVGDVITDVDYANGCHWFTPTHKACNLKAVWAQRAEPLATFRRKLKII